MGIAEHDARTHPDELVHEEEAGLEHLLENEEHARALRSRDDGGGHHVGRESGPGTVLQLGNVPSEVRPDPPLLSRAYAEPGSLHPGPNAQPLEAKDRAAQI